MAEPRFVIAVVECPGCGIWGDSSYGLLAELEYYKGADAVTYRCRTCNKSFPAADFATHAQMVAGPDARAYDRFCAAGPLVDARPFLEPLR